MISYHDLLKDILGTNTKNNYKEYINVIGITHPFQQECQLIN